MTKDLNKGISKIEYNLLNLPQQVDISSPLAEATNKYSYSAGGVKLRVRKTYNSGMGEAPIEASVMFPEGGGSKPASYSTVTSTTDYVGNKIFENNVLDRILVDGGYIEDGAYHFFLADHLGSNRLVVRQNREVVQRNYYYPYGGTIKMTLEGNGNQPFKFAGKEYDSMHGLNLYDSQARSYDPAVGRFTTVDPLAEKYYNISPYAYCAGNPLRYVDYRGDSISLAGLQGLDRVLNTDYTGTLKSDLESKTGLTYSIGSNGQMSYTKSNGNPVISTTTDANGNVVQVGSTTARNLMISAIDNSSTVTVSAGVRSLTDGPANAIGLNYNQINGFIQGAHGLDNTTMGWGMTFMHELSHTAVGGGLKDARGWGNIGAVETRMNTIRTELNVLGGNFGQRLNYESIHLPPNGPSYLPFNSNTVNIMGSGIIPATVPSMQFIKVIRIGR